MNKQAIWAIAAKDMRAITANLQVWLPMAIVPVILGLILPTLFTFLVARFGPGSSGQTEQIIQMLGKIPPSALKSALDALPGLTHQIAYLVANYMLAPFFLLIPVMTASVISADSFAGEKERSTLETLLFAPVDLLSLFLGKTLAALIPSLVLSFGTLALAAIAVNAAGWPLFHGYFFPQWNWLPLMLLVIPLISLLSILVTLYVSARAATFQAAYQMSGTLVLPVILLVAGQMSGLLLLSTSVLIMIGVGLLLLNGLLLRIMLSRLDRNRLFESQVK